MDTQRSLGELCPICFSNCNEITNPTRNSLTWIRHLARPEMATSAVARASSAAAITPWEILDQEYLDDDRSVGYKESESQFGCYIVLDRTALHRAGFRVTRI